VTTDTITSGGATRSGGNLARAQLQDLDWVRGARPSELRAAVHALCWRARRATIDGFTEDPMVARKVLITARGVAAELDARSEAVIAAIANRPNTARLIELQNERSSLRHRRATAESIIVTCDAALQFDQLGAMKPQVSASELVAAIVEHRRRVHPDDVCEADSDLWRVLDRIDTEPRPTPTSR